MNELLPMFEDNTVTVVWPERPRYLLSYAYMDDKQVQLARQTNTDLIIDSGAFTVANSGKTMDHEAYLEWLAANHDAVTFAFSLDVIGDHHATAVNHDYGRDKVGDLVLMVPTWHVGSPFNELRRMCKENRYVSIGGAVPFALQQGALMAVLRQAHDIAREHSTQLHGLGLTGNRVVHTLPWASVDSSAWLSCVRFPSLNLTTAAGRITGMNHGAPLDGYERELVRQYGGDPDVVGTQGWSLVDTVGKELAHERREWMMQATARSFMYVEAFKNGAQPTVRPLRLYLSGNSPSMEGGSVGVIARAHAMGSPWGESPSVTPESTDPTATKEQVL